MNLWMMVNTRAGRQRSRENGERIRRAFALGGAVPRVAYTATLEEADSFLEEAARQRPDLLVCCGGDGTLSQAVNRLDSLGASLPLGYIPLGTTNDFASSLELPRDPGKAAERILRGSLRPLDLGRLGDRLFLYVASFGAFTQSSYKTGQELKSALGHLAYVLESARELPFLRACPAEVVTEEAGDQGDFLFGAVTNSLSVGGVLHLDKDKVRLDDGLLELTLVRMPRNPWELGQILSLLRRGGWDGKLVIRRPVTQVEFRCSQPFSWSLDGQLFSGGEALACRVEPGKLPLVI